jgi:hypothetical protein
MVRVRAIVRRRKYFSIAPDEIAAQGAVHPYRNLLHFDTASDSTHRAHVHVHVHVHMCMHMYMCMYMSW